METVAGDGWLMPQAERRAVAERSERARIGRARIGDLLVVAVGARRTTRADGAYRRCADFRITSEGP
jgi:hypothetical protein